MPGVTAAPSTPGTLAMLADLFCVESLPSDHRARHWEHSRAGVTRCPLTRAKARAYEALFILGRSAVLLRHEQINGAGRR